LAGPVDLINCTITENHATDKKGGALSDTAGHAVVRNCILWNNRAKRAKTNEIQNKPSIGTTAVTSSIVQGGCPGTGNIDTDPLFVDPAGGDFRIQAASPCRDAGDNAALPNDPGNLNWDTNSDRQLPNDLSMRPRVSGETVDFGAHEWVSDR
jgi:hypothetical protein